MASSLVDFAQELKQKAPIEQLVRDYVPELVQRGHTFRARCPFHEEKTPSFHVNPEHGFYHCFGCNAHGDAIKFVQEFEKVDFRMAVESIARRFNVPLPEFGSSGTQQDRDESARKRKALLAICQLAEKFFITQLARHPAASAARDYLASRGLSPEQIKTYRLGFAPPGYENFLAEARRAGNKDTAIAESGVVSRSDRGKYYDRFRNRIIFPITNQHGETVAFGGRLMGDDEGPKYLNSADSPLFHKGELLYGLKAARDAIRDRSCAIVVEGYMDWIALHSHGIENVVAGLGTAFGASQARLLRRMTPKVCIFYDGDQAGQKAMFRASEHLLAEGVSARSVALPSSDDPDTFLRREGVEAAQQAIDNSPSAVDFFLDRMLDEGPAASAERKVEVVEGIAPLIRAIRKPEYKDAVISDLIDRVGFKRREDLDRALRKGSGWGGRSGSNKDTHDLAENDAFTSAPEVGTHRLEYALLHRMVTNIGMWDVFASADPDLFESEPLRLAFSTIYTIAKDVREGGAPPEDWFSICKEDREVRTMSHILLFEDFHVQGQSKVINLPRSGTAIEGECRELVGRLRRKRSNRRRNLKTHEVRKSREDKDIGHKNLEQVHQHGKSVLEETESILNAHVSET